MTTNNEAFIKLASDAGFYADDLAIKVFPHQYYSVSNTDITESLKQFYNATKAESEKEIAELKAWANRPVTDNTQVIANMEAQIAELKATINTYIANANHAVDIHAKDAETIAEVKARALEESNKYVAYCDLAESKITELQASNNRLREALEDILDNALKGGSIPKAREALSSTPDQSLAEHDD